MDLSVLTKAFVAVNKKVPSAVCLAHVAGDLCVLTGGVGEKILFVYSAGEGKLLLAKANADRTNEYTKLLPFEEGVEQILQEVMR